LGSAAKEYTKDNLRIDTVYIVVKDLPYGFSDVEEVFIDYDDAKKYIEDEHPYFTYLEKQKLWTYPDVTEESLELAESYKIVERSLRN